MHTLKTIHRAFEEQVAARPDAIAIDGKNRLYTYRSLNEHANHLAQLLIEAGTQQDMPIAFCMPRSPELLITILAILKAGGAYLPLDAAQPTERLLLLLKDSGCSLLILPQALCEKLAAFEGQQIVYPTAYSLAPSGTNLRSPLNVDPLNDSEQPINSAQSNPNKLAYIIYTSGSTGQPKGVLIEEQSVLNYAEWFSEYADLFSISRIDCSSQIIFDLAVTTSIVPLMLGKTLVLCEDDIKSSSKRYLQHLASECIELIKITPSYFQLLLHEAQNTSPLPPLPDLKAIILGGENLSTALCADWLKLYPHHVLYNEYGPTEATVGVSVQKISQENIHLFGLNIPIGTPCPYAAFHLLTDAEENENDVSGKNSSAKNISNTGKESESVKIHANKIQELGISGSCLARGYLWRPETTRQQFIPAPFDPAVRLYKTGDLCCQLPDGNWLYCGRKDNQVKVRGYRVEPTEIEIVLKRHPSIKDAVILLKEDNLRQKRLVAYYILRQPELDLSSHEVRLYLQAHLADYMVPSLFISVDFFPLTPNGKLDTNALPTPTLMGHADPIDCASIYSPLEQHIVKIWSEELGVNGLGLEDNFFELGGHSLSAARIVSRVGQELFKDVSLKDFYSASTVGAFANLIHATKQRIVLNDTTHPQTLPHDHAFPLSDFQLMLWLALTFEPKARNLNIVARKYIQGPLDISALHFAFEALLKHHDILTCRILKFRPAQKLQKKYRFELKQVNLAAFKPTEYELVLEAALQSLSTFHRWSTGSPLLLAKLYHLSSEKHELQICMPHIIADDVSPEIVFASLAKFYNAYLATPNAAQHMLEMLTAEHYMQEQIFKEMTHWEHHLTKDIQFWQDYLQQVDLFAFPHKVVMHNMIKHSIPYSTYTEIPRPILKKFQGFCTKNQVSLNNGLCAILGKVLYECSENKVPQSILMNLVKSTRDHPHADHALGCFLRLEPIKMTVDSHSTIADLMRQVHQSMLETYPYQRCPGLVKLASIPTFRKRKKWIYSVIQGFLNGYTALFRIQDPFRKIIKFSARLSSRGLKNRFLISLNMHSNFLVIPSKKSTIRMGNATLKSVKTFHEDLLQVDNYFDVCLIHDDAKDKPYIVISSNLQPPFRQSIAEKMIKLMALVH